MWWGGWGWGGVNVIARKSDWGLSEKKLSTTVCSLGVSGGEGGREKNDPKRSCFCTSCMYELDVMFFCVDYLEGGVGGGRRGRQMVVALGLPSALARDRG